MGLSEEMAERQRQAVESLIEAQRSGKIEAVETTLSLLSGQEEEVFATALRNRASSVANAA